MLKSTARTVSIYASPLRRRKIRSTFDFGSLLSSSRSNCQSLSSLNVSLPPRCPFDLVGADTGLKYSRNCSLTDSESSEEGGDEFVIALRRVISVTARDPRSRESSLPVCSGPGAGPLSCRVCTREATGDNVTASQLFWQKTMYVFFLPMVLYICYSSECIFPTS